MTYESWRISYQSSESAARAAWQEMTRLQHRVQELEAQLSAIGAGGVEPLRKRAAAPQAVQDDEKIQAAPCVTPADVEAAIASEHYYTGQIAAETESQHRALGGILNCTLVMKNGHLVSGEALLQDLSKPDPDRAQASARRRAFDKAYDMVVYAERERVAATTHPAEGVPAQAVKLLAADHSGMKVDYRGLFSQVQRALKRTDPGYAEMLRQLEGHLQELGQRWYAGDTDVVDEILQLYCIERDARKTLGTSATAAAQAKQGE